MRFATLLIAVVAMAVSPLLAAFLIEIDTDGMDDGVVTYNPDFSFGGTTTTAGQSSACTAIGMSGGDSIFGGNGNPDTYLYTYAPDAQADNLFLGPGVPLGDENFASGAAGGIPGTYAVYAAWNATSNVDGGLTNYLVQTDIDSTTAAIDQNGPGGFGSFGNVWVKLGEVEYESGDITVTQTPTASTFVSMRAAGVLFELVSAAPDPPYDGPPGVLVFGDGTNQFLGIAFERNKADALVNHHAVVRGDDLVNWATTDLKLMSVVDRDPSDPSADEIVTFRSMSPISAQEREFLAVRSTPKMPAVNPYVAMTYDDGPGLTTTPALLDILAARNIRATFYLVGDQVNAKPHIVRRMVNEGHEVGNHTMSHPNLTTLTEAEVIAEVQGCRDAIVGAAGVAPTTIRPPFGAVNQELRDLFLNQFGYPTILWDVDPRDWDQQVPDMQVINTILNNAEHDAIILAHDIHQRTIDVMPGILDSLLADGFTFVTISELLAMQAP